MEAIKKGFCEAMIKTFGNITQSCQIMGISRQTYYNWKTDDAEFKDAVEGEDYEERLLDFIESKLIKQADKDNTAVLIFMAKTKGKKRGYIEKSEMDLNHSGETKLIFNRVPDINHEIK